MILFQRHTCPTTAPASPGRTPFLVAAAWGRDEIIRTLIGVYRVDARASTDRQDSGGNNAVLLAARGGHAEMVKLLLSFGGTRTQRNSDLHSAVHLLAHVTDSASAVTCLRHLTALQPSTILQAFTGRDVEGRNPAHLSARAHNTALLRELFSIFGASMFIEEDNHGETPLDLLYAPATPHRPFEYLDAARSLPQRPSFESERQLALIADLEGSLTPAENRSLARRRGLLQTAGIPVNADTLAHARTSAGATVTEAPSAAAASIANQQEHLPSVEHVTDEGLVAEDETYEYVPDEAPAAGLTGIAADDLPASLDSELRRRVSDLGVAGLSAPPPPPRPTPYPWSPLVIHGG